MKRCTKCKKTKPLSDFHVDKKRVDGLAQYCRSCKNAMCRRSYKKGGKKTRDRVSYNRRKNISINRTYVLFYLKEHPCVDCGDARLPVLDFDHVMGKKQFCISYMITHHSLNNVLKEIAKCEVRCSNCHRMKTAESEGWHKLTV